MSRNALLLVLVCLMLGCATPVPPSHTRQEILYEDGRLQKFAYSGYLYGAPDSAAASQAPIISALTLLQQCDPKALPRLEDLPTFPSQTPLITRRYLGLIQNLSKYDVSIPSANSDATLIVPAHGWLEYVAWEPEVRLAGFVEGKQVYFQRLRVRPRAYQYLGNSYDFVATIQPVPPPSRR
jgi:hypothetical protein